MDSLKRATDCDQDRRLREDERFQEAQRALESHDPDQMAKFDDYMRDIDAPMITDQLKSAIAGSGFTYYKIMQETGVSDAAIGRFMSGERSITMETAAAISHFLGIGLVPKKKRRKTFGVSAFPLPFKSKAFAKAWGDWFKHRREIRKPMTKTAAEKMLAELKMKGEKRSIRAIEYTISNGWQGLREPQEMKGSGEYADGSLTARSEKGSEGFFEGEHPSPEAVAAFLRGDLDGLNSIPKSKGGRELGEEEAAALEKKKPSSRRRQDCGVKKAGDIIIEGGSMS